MTPPEVKHKTYFFAHDFSVSHLRFGQKAGNYDLVIAAARHYWNAIKPFIVEPIERELLKEPMEAVLECIAAVAANEVGKEDDVSRLSNNTDWFFFSFKYFTSAYCWKYLLEHETDARQHEIYLLINYLRFYGVNSVEPLITKSHERTHSVKVHATHKSYGPALY